MATDEHANVVDHASDFLQSRQQLFIFLPLVSIDTIGARCAGPAPPLRAAPMNVEILLRDASFLHLETVAETSNSQFLFGDCMQ
jgi:hypothetical protein